MPRGSLEIIGEVPVESMGTPTPEGGLIEIVNKKAFMPPLKPPQEAGWRRPAGPAIPQEIFEVAKQLTHFGDLYTMPFEGKPSLSTETYGAPYPIPRLSQGVKMPSEYKWEEETLKEGAAAFLSILPQMITKSATNPWLTLLSFAIYGAALGAIERKPPEEILTKEIPDLLTGGMLLMSAFPAAGKAKDFLKRLGEVGAVATKTASGEIFLSPSYYHKYFATPILNLLGKIANIPIIPKALEEKGLIYGRSIKELMQPGVARAPWSGAATLRKSEKSQAIMRQMTQGLVDELNALTPAERFHVSWFWSKGQWEPKGELLKEYMSLPLESKQRITRAMGVIGEWQQVTREKKEVYEVIREMSLRDNLQKLFRKALDEGEYGGLDPTFLKELKPYFTGEPFKPKKFMGMTYVPQVQVGLKKVIDHPGTSEETKAFAKDLYNLTANSLEILPKIARQAEEAVLFPKLRNNPMLTSLVKKPGFIQIDNKHFKGLWVEENTARAIGELGHIDSISSTIWNKFFMAPWKMGKVVLRIPTHFRNIYSNIVLNDWGGMPAFDPTGKSYSAYMEGIRELKKGGPIAKEFQKRTGYSTTFSDVETAHFPSALRYGANAFDIGEYLFSKITRPFARLYQMEESWAKLSKYIYNTKYLGMPKDAAALDAVKWTFNYGETTPFVRSLSRTIVPFAIWQTKSIPLMIETAIKHPVRFFKWAMVPPALTALGLKAAGMSPDEWQELKTKFPDYIKEGVFSVIPWRDRQGRLQLFNWTWMLPGIGDVADLRSQGLFTFLQHPVLTWAGNLRANETFAGAPIWYDWEPDTVKAWRMLNHTYLQFAPSIIGTDLRDIYRTSREFLFEPLGLAELGERKALTPAQLLAAQFGARITPVLEEEAKRQHFYKLKSYEREIRGKIIRELKNAKTDAARRSVVEKYYPYFRQVLEEH